MNKILAVFGCLVFVLALWGCGQQSEKISGQPQYEVWDGEPPDDEALPDFFGDQTQKNAFPESMVGVWEAEVSSINKWGIKFEPDGSILRIIHSVAGPVNVTEGGVDGGTEEACYIFVMGPCEARYMPETRTIKVKIIVDYFIFKFPVGELEGRIEDYFEGPVSEDGKTWEVEWLDFCWLEGAIIPDINLIKAYPIPLVFTKLDLTQIKQKDSVQ